MTREQLKRAKRRGLLRDLALCGLIVAIAIGASCFADYVLPRFYM